MARENIKLGACNATFKSTALGLTKGGVEVTVETTTHEVNVDQHGDAAVDEWITKRSFTVAVPMAETTLEKLGLALPGSEMKDGQLVVKNAVGLSLIDGAGELKLIPVNGTADDVVVFPKANTAGNFSFAYRHNEERVYSVEFKVYPADDQTVALFGTPLDGTVTDGTTEPVTEPTDTTTEPTDTTTEPTDTTTTP